VKPILLSELTAACRMWTCALEIPPKLREEPQNSNTHVTTQAEVRQCSKDIQHLHKK